MTSESQAVRAPALEMRGITKRYPGVVANDAITLDVRPGEIHALLGENGAGKTTLMNVLYGLAKPDEGQILLDGAEVHLAGPSDAIKRGISMVHQHFMLVPVLTVAENIVLGDETMSGPFFLDRKQAHERIIALGRRFGFEVDPEAKVGSLSVGWQQRVEILKALYRDARILVLDEPTAVLTPQETDEIFEVLRRLAAEGHSIVFISHKLYEVLAIADRITVIRRGKVVGERIPSETDEEDLAELMVGREVSLVVDRGESHPAEGTLKVEGLVVKDDRGQEVVHGIDLDVRAGEILGIAGVAGNGQDELVEAIVGLRKPIMAQTPGQRAYLEKLKRDDLGLIFGVGPAGTGKTFLAVAVGAAELKAGKRERLIVARPAVEAGEKLGFLPGTHEEKVDPYMLPIWDALNECLGAPEVDRRRERREIEVAPLAFMRGRTLKNAFVIVDEAQNATVPQMKMVLTRLGRGSRMIVTGDPSQTDLPDKTRSGLDHAVSILRGVKGVALEQLTAADVVRHELVGRIIDAYDRDAARGASRK